MSGANNVFMCRYTDTRGVTSFFTAPGATKPNDATGKAYLFLQARAVLGQVEGRMSAVPPEW